MLLPQPPLLLPPLVVASVPVSPTAGLMIADSSVVALAAFALSFWRLASAHIPCDSAKEVVHRVVR